jgi:hypothetical protein
MEWRRANSKRRQPGVYDRGCFLSVFAASTRAIAALVRERRCVLIAVWC